MSQGLKIDLYCLQNIIFHFWPKLSYLLNLKEQFLSMEDNNGYNYMYNFTKLKFRQ